MSDGSGVAASAPLTAPIELIVAHVDKALLSLDAMRVVAADGTQRHYYELFTVTTDLAAKVR